MTALLSSLIACLPLVPQLPGTDWVISSGTTVTYDTTNGPLSLDDVTIEAGGTLRVVGPHEFRLRATGTLHIGGTLDLSGFGFGPSGGVVMFNATNLQQPGQPGGPGGARGGTGNPINYASCPVGGDAHPVPNSPFLIARGGETGISDTPNVNNRRGGGGGGGAFGPALPLVHPDPYNVLNDGRVARAGEAGALLAHGALHPDQRPQGGAHGASAFNDADPSNDFYGTKLVGGSLIVGELPFPLAGAAGGAGSNAIMTISFPAGWTPTGDEVGSGGGGGGGLGILLVRKLEIGPVGRLLCNGGNGGAGENTNGLNHVGGGSGGGSGGMVLVQARFIDLANASDNCIRALGGAGGLGADHQPDADCAGGDGGPGLIQFHVPNGMASVLLPSGASLEQLTVPTAHVLLPLTNP
jgi:hypothetical protein